MGDKLAGWTIYASPSDYPGQFVARRWFTRGNDVVATSDMFVGDTIDEVRELLPPGLTCIGRMPGDEQQIVEVWI